MTLLAAIRRGDTAPAGALARPLRGQARAYQVRSIWFWNARADHIETEILSRAEAYREAVSEGPSEARESSGAAHEA